MSHKPNVAIKIAKLKQELHRQTRELQDAFADLDLAEAPISTLELGLQEQPTLRPTDRASLPTHTLFIRA